MSIRFCVDYRCINAVTRKDAYPLPKIDETLDTLAGSNWFSTLNLISGYWQVKVSPEDQERTAFTDMIFKVGGLCDKCAHSTRKIFILLCPEP